MSSNRPTLPKRRNHEPRQMHKVAMESQARLYVYFSYWKAQSNLDSLSENNTVFTPEVSTDVYCCGKYLCKEHLYEHREE